MNTPNITKIIAKANNYSQKAEREGYSISVVEQLALTAFDDVAKYNDFVNACIFKALKIKARVSEIDTRQFYTNIKPGNKSSNLLILEQRQCINEDLQQYADRYITLVVNHFKSIDIDLMQTLKKGDRFSACVLISAAVTGINNGINSLMNDHVRRRELAFKNKDGSTVSYEDLKPIESITGANDFGKIDLTNIYINQLLAKLPARQGQAVRLYLDGYNYTESADTMRISVKSVRELTLKGLAKIKTVMTEEQNKDYSRYIVNVGK